MRTDLLVLLDINFSFMYIVKKCEGTYTVKAKWWTVNDVNCSVSNMELFVALLFIHVLKQKLK